VLSTVFTLNDHDVADVFLLIMSVVLCYSELFSYTRCENFVPVCVCLFLVCQNATVTQLVYLPHLQAVGRCHQVNFANAKTECMDEPAMNVVLCSGIYKPQIWMAVKV
jgi:hypothetical protein